MINHKPMSVYDAFTRFVEHRDGRIPYNLPGAERITARNRVILCHVLVVIDIMCHRTNGTPFFLGSDTLGECFGVAGNQAYRWLEQLRKYGFITRTWTGGLCRVDQRGERYKRNLKVVKGKVAGAARASEYVYNRT